MQYTIAQASCPTHRLEPWQLCCNACWLTSLQYIFMVWGNDIVLWSSPLLFLKQHMPEQEVASHGDFVPVMFEGYYRSSWTGDGKFCLHQTSFERLTTRLNTVGHLMVSHLWSQLLLQGVPILLKLRKLQSALDWFVRALPHRPHTNIRGPHKMRHGPLYLFWLSLLLSLLFPMSMLRFSRDSV